PHRGRAGFARPASRRHSPYPTPVRGNGATHPPVNRRRRPQRGCRRRRRRPLRPVAAHRNASDATRESLREPVEVSAPTRWETVAHGHGGLGDCQRWTGRTPLPRRASRRRSGVPGENIARAGVSIRRGPRRLSGGVLYAAFLQRLVAPRHEGEVIMKIVVIGGTWLLADQPAKSIPETRHASAPPPLASRL